MADPSLIIRVAANLEDDKAKENGDVYDVFEGGGDEVKTEQLD